MTHEVPAPDPETLPVDGTHGEQQFSIERPSYGCLRMSKPPKPGKTDNTTAIQAAIDRCALGDGGIVPIAGGGVYLTGPIELRSRVLLRISAPTVLKNTNDHTRYQPAFIGYPFQFANNPAVTGTGPLLPGKPEAMISAVDVVESGIIGDGTIDGSGADPAALTEVKAEDTR